MSKKIWLSSLLMLTILLSGCLPLPVEASQPTPNASTLEAVIVSTLIAQITRTAGAVTNTPIIVIITATPAPTKKPTRTQAPSPTAVPASFRCDKGAFVADVTVPDGTSFAPGRTFLKTWRLQNVGTCTWTPDYQIIFAGGDNLSAAKSFNLPTSVDPGQTVDISVQMVAPTKAGSFEGFWKLLDPNGNTFGVGDSGIVAFSTLITVGAPPIPFAVEHVLMSVDSSSITADCPAGHKFTVTANIFSNGPGKVTYAWEFNDGNITADKTLNFPVTGTQTVSTTIKVTKTGDYWARVVIDNPNHQNFQKISFSLTCK